MYCGNIGFRRQLTFNYDSNRKEKIASPGIRGAVHSFIRSGGFLGGLRMNDHGDSLARHLAGADTDFTDYLKGRKEGRKEGGGGPWRWRGWS